MNWSDLKGAIGRVAPVVGTALGGPAGGAVGALVSSALGVEESPDAVAEALQNDPKAAVKLRELQTRHRERLEELALQGEQARLADRQDARRRDVEITQASGNNLRGDILAVTAILGLIGLIITLVVVEVPDGPARDVLLLLAGGLVAIVKDVYAFEFGSSRGSKDKDGVLSRLKATIGEGG